MSIEVALADLATTLERYPWALLVTVGDDQRPRVLAVPTRYGDGAFAIDAGRSARANATARPDVTLVFPPASGAEYSLIVDGRATVCDDAISVEPTWAVLHRPAL
jgi:hypothetical protein